MKTNPELKDFIMMVGVPGSGKTCYAVATFPTHVYLSTDVIIDSMKVMKNKKYSEVFNELIDPAVEVIDGQLKLASWAKEDILLDQTNTTIAARKRKLEILRNPESYWKVAIVCEVPDNLLDLRLTKRESSGKIIPKDVLKRFKDQFQMPTLEEGFDEIKIISI